MGAIEDMVDAVKAGSAADYLVVGDPDKSSTWHLQVKKDGKPDHTLMGAAWAALHEGYRGNKYEGPDKDKALAKLESLYKSEGMPTPGSSTKAEPWAIKALDNWELDVRGVPFGNARSKDTDGEYFDSRTNLVEDRYPLPPVVYYHGFTVKGRPNGDPVFIGKTVSTDKRADGMWYRVALDSTNEFARRIWESAKAGTAAASSGSIAHLVRRDPDGHIRFWPVAELSLLDAVGGRASKNKYACVMPVLKAVYQQAGLTLPEGAESAAGARSAGDAKGATGTMPDRTSTKSQGERDMDPEEVTKIIQDALKAEREAREKEEREKAAEAAVKALADENAALKAQLAAKNRLPGGNEGSGAPAQLKIDRRFDDLTPAEHAFLVGVAGTEYRSGRSKQAPTEGCMKALILKTEAEAAKGKDESAVRGFKAMCDEIEVKGGAFKANEIDQSTLSNYASDWVGTQYSTDLWLRIRAEQWILNKLSSGGTSDMIPDGYSSDTIPLEDLDPTWYKIAQGANITSGRPDVTITASKIKSSNKNITVAKMGCRTLFTGELNEDSLINWVPNAMRQIAISGGEQFEFALIDGDTATAGTTNINSIGGTPASTDLYLLCDGFRKLPLITNTAASRAQGGPLNLAAFLATSMLMGNAGVNAADPTKVTIILDAWTYIQALQLAQVLTRDVNTQAVIESGMLTNVWGFEVKRSYFMQYAGVNYGTVTGSNVLKSNTAGKVDQTTPGNNVCGALLSVRWDQWKLKWKRRMMVETTRYPESDTTQIVAQARWGLGYRDTNAAAITYGITGV